MLTAAKLTNRPRIAAGDLVIVYEDFKHLHAVRVEPPQTFESRFGSFPHAQMVGKLYGQRMGGAGGFVYLLSPSAELWTQTLPHRTQILYIADVSMIVMHLELRPGSVVIEAGTGSGALTHALARATGPRGAVHTFEFNAQRAQLAAREFEANGLGGRITCLHGDVCADDWTYEAHLPRLSADAVIFDLPQPWDAVRRAAPYLRPGARLCCFSPCIEQVARTMDALREEGFTGAECIETIVRTHEVRPAPSQPDAISLAVEQAARARQAATVDGEMADASGAPTASAAPVDAATQPPTDGAVASGPASGASGTTGLEASTAEMAATATAHGEASERSKRAGDEPEAPAAKRSRRGDGQAHQEGSARNGAAATGTQLRTRPYADMRGHTGFLLFAVKNV